MQDTNDKVLLAYQHLGYAVARYITSHTDDFETLPVEMMLIPLKELGALYGVDTDAYAKTILDNNDISAAADALRGDDLCYVRITGTLCLALSDVASCVYDVEASYQIVEVIGRMLGAILTIKEFENA